MLEAFDPNIEWVSPVGQYYIGGVQKGHAAGLEAHLSPYGLSASFVTLDLEGGARLQQVQYAVGHADPRTTERYQRRKLNLDDHASDYLKI